MTDEQHTALARTTLVIPCFNGGEHIAQTIARCLEVTPNVLVVDDGSTDGAMDTLDPMACELIRFPENRGKGHALMAGFAAALEDPEAKAVCVVDADGQHDPAELPRLMSEFQTKNADLLIGSRTFDQEDVPWRSRVGNKLTIGLTSLLLGRRISDTQSGYRIHSRRLVEMILRKIEPGRYETEMEILVMAVRMGFIVTAAPIATRYEKGNPTSHFHKLRDSILIYRRLLRAVMKDWGSLSQEKQS